METVATANVGIGGSVTIGRHHTLSTSYFDGYLGKSRIYERALTAADVGVLFAQDRTKYGISDDGQVQLVLVTSAAGSYDLGTAYLDQNVGDLLFHASYFDGHNIVWDAGVGGVTERWDEGSSEWVPADPWIGVITDGSYSLYIADSKDQIGFQANTCALVGSSLTSDDIFNGQRLTDNAVVLTDLFSG